MGPVTQERLRAFRRELEAGDRTGLLKLFQPGLRPIHPLPLDPGLEPLVSDLLNLTDLRWGLAVSNVGALGQVYSARAAGRGPWPPWVEGAFILRGGADGGPFEGLELFLEGPGPTGPRATLDRLLQAFLSRDLQAAMAAFSPEVSAFGGLLDHRTEGRLALQGSVEAAFQMSSLEITLTAWCGSRALRAWRAGALDGRGNQAVVEGLTLQAFAPDHRIQEQETFLAILDALRILTPRPRS